MNGPLAGIRVIELARILAGSWIGRILADLVADFSTEDSQRMVQRLVKRGDILIENFKVGGLKKSGLDFAPLSKLNPRRSCCSVTGFGQIGPYAHRPGYDFIILGPHGELP